MKEPLKLVIHLPADQLDPDAANALPQAIHHYFNYRLEEPDAACDSSSATDARL